MLKPLFISLLVMNFALAEKLTMDARRKQILEIVDQELSEVTRLAKQENFGSPDTLLRVSELNLEKARLWRETENEQYLAIPPEERRSVNKKDYFKKSAQYFEAANDAAEVVVKRFGRYKAIEEVYYILAYNHKELGNNDLARKYFELSAGKSSSKSKIKLKSNLALADFKFNAHQYAEAIPLYESGLSKINERWWTKDAFNLAWCYYRTRNYDKAISLMRDVHRKSGDSKYINMKTNVERDIGIFFIDAGKMNEAVKFYTSLGINYTEQFIKIATSITTQGRFSQAESLLEEASKFEKDRNRKITIGLAQLDLFDKYNKVEQHLEVSQSLMKLHLEKAFDQDDLKKFTYQVNKKAAELQKVVAAQTYKDVPKVQKAKSSQAMSYFELASQLSPAQKGEKIFYQAETAYAAGDYAKSLELYLKSFESSVASQDKKLISQTIEGMLSSLGQEGLNKSIADRFYIPVYTKYLSVDKKSERANSIYVKLFNAQMEKGDVSDGEKTLADFAASFPQDYKTQEGMLAKVMEHYRSKKDYSKVKSYVAAINDGQFKVSKKYAEALRSLMTKIQIEGVQQSLEKGDKDIALKGYHKIYEDSQSTPKAKVNAAYNLSVLYYEMGDTNQSYEWGVTALNEMEAADVVKFADSYLTIAAGLFLKQNFTESADLSHKLLSKICKEDSSNKVVAFKNAAFIALANGDIDKALEIKEFGKTCLIPDAVITEVSLELTKDLSKQKKWEQVEAQMIELEKNSKNYPVLIRPYEDLRKVYVNLGDMGRAKEIEQKQNQFFEQSRTQKLDIPVESLDLMAGRMISSILEKKARLDQIQLQFPENEFNNAVKAKLQLLDQMAQQVNLIQKIGSGKGIVDAYKIVIESYELFGESLKKFTPEGKGPEYIESFQAAMSKVYLPILETARKQRNEIKKLVHDNKILSLSNFSVLFSASEGFKRYFSPKQAVLMERGGKR
jgi:hypothetical protein